MLQVLCRGRERARCTPPATPRSPRPQRGTGAEGAIFSALWNKNPAARLPKPTGSTQALQGRYTPSRTAGTTPAVNHNRIIAGLTSPGYSPCWFHTAGPAESPPTRESPARLSRSAGTPPGSSGGMRATLILFPVTVNAQVFNPRKIHRATPQEKATILSLFPAILPPYSCNFPHTSP